MRLSSLLLTLLLVASCTSNNAKLKNLVVVELLNKKLLAVDFSQKLTQKLKNLDAASAKDPQFVDKVKREIVNSFILTTLVADYAKKNSIIVTSTELDAEVDFVRKSYPSDLAFKESLANAGLLVADWRLTVSQTLLQKKVAAHIFNSQSNKKVYSSEELKSYYQSHLSDFNKNPEVKISQIVVKTQEEAQKLLKTIRSGQMTFEAAAQKFSLSPDSKMGGDIGFMVKGVVPVFDIAFNMPVGQLSPVLKSPYGFHILKVTAKKPALKISFEQARQSIIKTLDDSMKAQLFDDWYSEQLKTVKIHKDQNLLDNIKIYTEGSFE